MFTDILPRRSAKRSSSKRRHLKRRPRTAAVALAVLAGLVAVPVALAAQPAYAATGSVTVANASGAPSADPDYATPMTITGNGFQSIQGGFGGIYVLFGWVDDPAGSSWAPTAGGSAGDSYRYVPDAESKDNAGFQRFIAFPGSDTEDAANAIMGADGSWSVDMVVPGASFESLDRAGDVSEVNCLEVQCGIITIGAHGVKNGNNETFTPINFVTPAAAAAPVAPVTGTGDAAAGTPAATTPDTAAASPAAAGATRVGYTTASAVAGNVLSFTGQGFAAGEQVVATLDDGVAAVGPLTAGPSGEVAGVLQLPSDLRAGTHLLVLNGAASASVAETNVTVTAHAATLPTAAEQAPPVWPYLALGIAILIAVALLVTSLITTLVRASRRRRERRDQATRADTIAQASNSTQASTAQAST
ncbi:MAG: hypothetical protein JWQ43_3752, partial [Glaciihabitans sp.]|nr:hypothetical protein [Glaciihabitans sp.]